jgi:hypothetical protein
LRLVLTAVGGADRPLREADVRSWPKADIRSDAANVRS